MKKPNPLLRTILYVVAIAVGVLIYAYGWEITEISLTEPQKEERQSQVMRALRGLLTPDLIARDEESMEATAFFMVPCGVEPPAAPQSDGEQAITLSPVCGVKGDVVTVQGTGFRPNTGGFLYWSTPSGSERPVASLRSDAQGDFSASFTLPTAAEFEDPYTVRAAVRWPVGAPRPSEALILTIEKMIETVFMALVATTLAIPIAGVLSFIAAGNLMRQVKMPTGALLMGLILLPLGWIAGSSILGITGSAAISTGERVWPAFIGLAVLGGVVYAGSSGALTHLKLPTEGIAGFLVDLVRTILIAVVVWFAVGQLIGLLAWLVEAVSGAGAVGKLIANFVGTLTTLAGFLLRPVGGAVGAFVAFGLGGDLGTRTTGKLRGIPGRAAGLVLGALAVGLLGAGILAGIAQFYQLSDPVRLRNIAAIVGAVIGGLGGAAIGADRQFPLGMTIYYLSRTILNALRAIEPLIMAIVFAIWVGLGPFAGVLALMLHSVAGLGKLYSEQVESIDPGPIEAIQATGANRLQTIVYAVLPQIVPPYTAFTIYRWDINVRMSTIIGFVGGGGIGFILQQWINLLRYRQAGVAMLAIAIVVAVLDFASAKLREKII
jgi:phosphonate ABC transporter permease subunit PhnE